MAFVRNVDDGDDLLSDLKLFYCDTATFGESAPNIQQVSEVPVR